MASVHRISRVLKAAACAGVIGIIGSFMAPTANASLVTLELVPTTLGAGTSGVIAGQNVTINGAGSVNFNVVAVLHSTDSNWANDGVEQLGMSFLSDSGGLLGSFAGQLSQLSFSQGQTGTQTATNGTASSGGPDLGPDRVGGTNSNRSLMYWPQSSSGSMVNGPTGTNPGDLAMVIGTGTFTTNGTLGSTVLNPLWHTDTSTLSSGRTQLIEVDGTTYSLNGNQNGIVVSGTGTIPATSFDNNGGQINLTVAPEPASLGLLGIGGLGLLLRRRRSI